MYRPRTFRRPVRLTPDQAASLSRMVVPSRPARRCPRCYTPATVSDSRTCAACGYRGDWIQPGHAHLYGCPAHREDGQAENTFAPECRCGQLAASRPAV
jgi:hypothetical protein